MSSSLQCKVDEPFRSFAESRRPAFARLLFVNDLGKVLIALGAVLLLAGVVFLLLGRTNLPLGRLPGDILYKGKSTTFYFPLTTSIVLSVVLTIVLYVVGRFRH